MSRTVVVGRRRRWWWARLMTAVLVAAGLWVPGKPASTAGAPAVCTGSAPSESVAAAMATECDRRVQVDSQTSEYTRVVALPSGLMELEQTAVPVRVRRGDSWVRVDTTLEVLPDGRPRPKASTVDIRFSRGGRDDLASLSVAGGSVVVSWPGELPKPSLAGETAVYAEVLPGVDLRLRATTTGFTHVLVVKSAAAAADPALRSIRYGWSVRGLSATSRADGGLDISNGSEVVLSVASGAMWDSTGGSAHMKAAGSNAVAPGEAARIAPVDVALSEAELVVTPNLDLLTDPATVFPVYIDPPVEANRNRWGYSNSANQNRNDGVVRVGKSPDDGVVWRSYFEFDLSGVANKFVYDARFYINATHSSDCAPTPVSLYVTSGMDPGVNGTRTSAPSLGARVDEKWVQANATYPCFDPSPVGMEFGHELFYNVRWHTDRAYSMMTLGLVTNENEHRYWKKFNPASARMKVWYNTHPNPPVPQAFSSATECHQVQLCMSTVAASSATTQAQGWWKLNETSGSTAADAATPPHPATAAGSYSWSDGGIAFTGGGDLYTNGPVLDTTKSFTVSVWAKLTNTNGYYTMVSQDGNTASAFWLRFDWGAQRWVFLRAGADAMYPSLVSASAPVPVQVNTWVHVVGVYTNEPRETSMTIYVNGVRYETVWADPVFGATGPLVIGRAKWLGGLNDRFVGGIDNVQVYQRRLTNGDVTTLFQAGRSGGALNIAPAMVRTTTPELKIQVSDAEPDSQLKYGFEIYSAPSETAPVVYASGPGGPVRAPAVVGHRVAADRLAPNTTYYWRARVEDVEEVGLWSSFWSPFQALRVDTDRPIWSSPPVSSPEYPERQFGLVSGSAGSFTFFAASTDVIEFEWWVDNQPVHSVVPAAGSGPRAATVSYTPPTPDIHVMHVKARDAVGLEVQYDYSFWVEAPPNVYAHWKLDEASGTTAADSGNAPAYGGSLSPLTLSGSGVRFGPGYIDNGLVFTGNGAAAAARPVLDTTSEFTVMAWVNPADLTGDRTIVSQDGGGSSRFELRFDREANGGAGGWCVSMRPAETAAPVSACADGSMFGLPVTDAWVHVAAVFNPALTGQQLRIYVMGDPESCFPAETAAIGFVGAWSVTGAFVVGRARQAGADTRFWRGGIDDVRAHQIALRGDEICRIAQP